MNTLWHKSVDHFSLSDIPVLNIYNKNRYILYSTKNKQEHECNEFSSLLTDSVMDNVMNWLKMQYKDKNVK